MTPSTVDGKGEGAMDEYELLQMQARETLEDAVAQALDAGLTSTDVRESMDEAIGNYADEAGLAIARPSSED